MSEKPATKKRRLSNKMSLGSSSSSSSSSSTLTGTGESHVIPALLLSKTIENFLSEQHRFEQAAADTKTWCAALQSELAFKVTNAQKQLLDLEEEYQKLKKTKQFELDMEFRQKALAKAEAVFTENGKIAVSQDEWNLVREQLDDLKKKYDKDMAQQKLDAIEDKKAALAFQKQNLDLSKAAELAKIDALAESMMKQKEQMELQNQTLQSELKEQRNLTRMVAEANRPLAQPMQMMHAQQPQAHR